MTNMIKQQFQIIKNAIRVIDNSRTRTDLRKNQALLKSWNNSFKWLEDNAKTNYDRAIVLAYYGALSARHCQMLNWEQFKKLTLDIMKGEMLL